MPIWFHISFHTCPRSICSPRCRLITDVLGVLFKFQDKMPLLYAVEWKCMCFHLPEVTASFAQKGLYLTAEKLYHCHKSFSNGIVLISDNIQCNIIVFTLCCLSPFLYYVLRNFNIHRKSLCCCMWKSCFQEINDGCLILLRLPSLQLYTFTYSSSFSFLCLI